MTPDELETKIDAALDKVLDLFNGLAAKDENSKPAITPKEATETLKVAIDYWKERRAPNQVEYGAALRNGGNRG